MHRHGGGHSFECPACGNPWTLAAIPMNTSKFKDHLDKSLEWLLTITREYCYNELSNHIKFIIEPSGLDFHDGLNDFEKKNLINLNRYGDKLLAAEQVIALLCHDDKVPLWINTTVYESRAELTVIHLFCSRRLRQDSELFHQAVKYPPFNTLVPLPPDSLRKEINGKFDINWKKHLDDRRKPQKNILIKIKEFFKR